MIIRDAIPFMVTLAIATSATAQTTGGVPGGVQGGVQGGVVIRPAIPPIPPVPPLEVLGPIPTLDPLGPEPAGGPRLIRPALIGPGPVGPGPIGPGPVGLGPIGPGPLGPGPIGLGPLGPGPFIERPLEQDRASAQQDREREQREREAERARAEREREASLYEQGYNALSEGRYDRAVSYFSRLAEQKGSRADAALHWKAYAQSRLGQRAEALATIAELTKTYPTSRYLKEARALEAETRRDAGQPVSPDAQADDDLKVYALDSLARQDPEQAVPLLEKLITGTASPRLKNRALFVLARINTARAREILKNIAKGSSIPELQSRAIQYLGQQSTLENRATLAEIYASTTDVDVKRRILRAFMASGEKARLLTVAQTEQNPELRIEAVRQLGAMGANEELWQMYQKEGSGDVKRQILSAMQAGGNVTRMIEIAKSEKDPELRRIAVRNLGVMGSKAGGDALVEIYGIDKDPVIRKQVINSLFTQGNATALVALARKEQDMSMKTEMVQKLANMDNKVARDYMLELLK
jgi:HEAT repeat protein